MRISINRKLLMGVVLSSALVTVFVTIFQLYQEYNSQIDVTYAQMDTLIHINGDALETSLWDLNQPQVDSILKGFFAHKTVDYIQLEFESTNGKSVKNLGSIPKEFFNKTFELVYDENIIGKITFYSDKEQVYTYLWGDLFQIIVANGVKTLFASFLILYMINFLLTQHLVEIANYFSLYREATNHDEELTLERFGGEQFNKNDELFILVSKINEMLSSIKGTHQHLEEKIRVRTCELQKAKDVAEKAVKVKAMFLANMSHEIRTPMNGIYGCANLLLKSINQPENKELIEIIIKSGDTLLVLINDILDFSKIESGHVDLEHLPVNLRDILFDVQQMLEGNASKNNVDFKTSVAEEVPVLIYGDTVRIKQILTNFISNAIKFTKDGEVKVEIIQLSRAEKEVELQFIVSDEGIGIPKESLENLFKEFSQVDSSTTRKFGGTGLGLAICKGLVEAMKGQIHVESEVGKGSVFSFIIKAMVAEHREFICLTDEHVKKMERKHLPKIKILVAEDNKINQFVARKILNKLGYNPTIVDDGYGVLQTMEKETFDLILMDQHMPGLDGVETTKMIIEKYSNDKRPKIIALTASAMKEDRDFCLDAGMDAFLSKPMNEELLVEKIYDFFGPGEEDRDIS